MEKFILGVLVNNQFGVLTRVSSLFSRRGFNIDSLSVGVTENPICSRMTIVACGDEHDKEQIVKQLEKLQDVIKVEILTEEKSVAREILLIKLKVNKEERVELMQTLGIFTARVLDFDTETVVIEVTGSGAKLDAFVKYMHEFEIMEMCRTGLTAMARGENLLKND